MIFSKQPKLDVIMGTESSFWGELNSKGTVRIDGSMEGNLTVDSLIVGEKAIIKGSVSARQAVVGGRVVGNVRATESVEIQHTGEVFGDVCSIRFTISEGGRFEGRSTMLRTKELACSKGEEILLEEIVSDNAVVA